MHTQLVRSCLVGTCRRSLAACFVLLAGPSNTSLAAIIVPAVGTAVQTFDTQPAANEWATITSGVPGSAVDVNTTAEMDVLVQTLTAGNFVSQLPTSAGIPPTINSAARYNTNPAGLFVQTHPTGVTLTVLLAKLENGGPTATDLNVSYEQGVYFDPGESAAEEVPGQRAYYSLTGATDSWTPIGSFDTAGPVTFALPLGAWASGSPLYLLWADDNAIASSGAGELAYTIDNIAFTPVPEPATAAIFGIGLMGLVGYALRRRSAQRVITNASSLF